MCLSIDAEITAICHASCIQNPQIDGTVKQPWKFDECYPVSRVLWNW